MNKKYLLFMLFIVIFPTSFVYGCSNVIGSQSNWVLEKDDNNLFIYLDIDDTFTVNVIDINNGYNVELTSSNEFYYLENEIDWTNINCKPFLINTQYLIKNDPQTNLQIINDESMNILNYQREIVTLYKVIDVDQNTIYEYYLDYDKESGLLIRYFVRDINRNYETIINLESTNIFCDLDENSFNYWIIIIPSVLIGIVLIIIIIRKKSKNV